MIAPNHIPELDSCLSLSRRAGVHRAVIMRLVAVGLLEPDAWLVQPDGRLPLFTAQKAVEVLRLQKVTRKTAQQT